MSLTDRLCSRLCFSPISKSVKVRGPLQTILLYHALLFHGFPTAETAYGFGSRNLFADENKRARYSIEQVGHTITRGEDGIEITGIVVEADKNRISHAQAAVQFLRGRIPPDMPITVRATKNQ